MRRPATYVMVIGMLATGMGTDRDVVGSAAAASVLAAPGFDFHQLPPPSLPLLRVQAQEVTTMQDVQRYLQREGLYDGALDGRWGPRTEQGLIGLWERATTIHESGDYIKAVEMRRVLVAGLEIGLGHEHQHALGALTNLSDSLSKQGKYTESEAIMRQVIAAMDRTLGVEHPNTLVALNSLGLNLQGQGKYAEAEAIMRRVLAAMERTLGVEHPNTLVALGGLGLNLQGQGKYAEAEAIMRRVLAAMERTLGVEHPNTLVALGGLGRSLQGQGKYTEAEEIYRRLIFIREQVLGPEHPNTLYTFNTLASVLINQGRYADASAIQKRLLPIQERVLGEDHQITLDNLTGLSVSLRFQGQYAEAETILRRLIPIQERVLGDEHPDTLIKIGELANNLNAQGNYIAAENILRRLLPVLERVLGEEHPDTLRTLEGLAVSLGSQSSLTDPEATSKKSEEAERILRRIFGALQRTLGAEHPETLRILKNLAINIQDQGRLADAEVILRRLLPVEERVLGSEHPETLRTLGALATSLWAQSEYAEVEEIKRHTLPIQERILGAHHLDTLRTLSWLAASLWNQDRHIEAISVIEQGFLALPGYFALGGSAGVQAQAEQLPLDLGQYLAGLELLEGPDIAARSFTAQGWLAFGPLDFTLGDVAARQAVSEGAGASALRAYQEAREALQGARAVYLASFEEGGDEAARSSLTARVNEAEDAFEAAQARLSPDFPELADLTLPQPLTAAEAQGLLAPGEALVAYAFTDGMLDAWLVSRETVRWERIEVDEAEVAGMVRRLRQSLDFQAEAPDVPTDGCALESVVPALSERPFDACLAHELHDLVLGRFDLSDVESLIVVPDGPLETLPFSVLVSEPPVGGTPRWLIGDHPIAVLPTTSSLRALRRASAAGSASDRKPYLGIAPVEFGTVGDGAIRRDALVSLPGTRDEVERLAAILGAGPADAVVGAAATESFVKSARLSDYRVLSFATHGLLTREAEALSGGRLTEPALALAPSGDGEDGFLTASEAAGLRLDADWVLLSACNTAAGDGEDAEGLSGLARAFFFAGADALLVSHWSVDDASAQDLMARTMERAGRDPELGKAQALRDAMLALQADSDTAHPFFWAPFDLVGDGL